MYGNEGLVSLETVALRWFGIFSSWLIRIHDNKVKQNTLRQNCSCQFWDPHSVIMKIASFVVPCQADQSNWKEEGGATHSGVLLPTCSEWLIKFHQWAVGGVLIVFHGGGTASGNVCFVSVRESFQYSC